MSIRRLPEQLVNRIAAGEVVERPAGALKELVENALDAGATRVAVTLADGGLTRIEVSDDGCGMNPADMALALERHATSKLPSDAIEAVSTMGFRGEALPSIASVARLTLESRVRDADGWRRVVDNGLSVGEGPAALPPGTRVVVGELFARVPARRKFMRSPRAEYAACLDAVRRLAMARADVAFSVEHDGRRVLSVSAGDDRAARVAALTDRALADNAVLLDVVREGWGLSGVAGLPTFHRGVADHQYLFVNARPVKDRLLLGAIRGAYAEMMPRDRHAVVALFLDAPTTEVDVNVHPAKTEVRFREPALVRGLIVSSLRRALDEAGHRVAQRPAADAMAMFRPEVAPAGEGWPAQAHAGAANHVDYRAVSRFSFHDRRATFMTPSPAARAETASEPVPITADHPLGVARGQVAQTYIVAESSDGLILVDQHAAHERLVLERLRAMGDGQVAAQTLLLPEVVELDEPACDRVEARAAELARFGLEVERFGPRAVLVRATPAPLGTADSAALIRDLADELAAFDEALSLRERLDRIAGTIACHGSVRAGQRGTYLVTPETFAEELAPARTFGFVREVEALRARGLIQGASTSNAVVLDDTGVVDGALRWSDEFVRHKALDCVGDLALAGRRMRVRVVAHRPSHRGTIRFVRALVAAARPPAPSAVGVTPLSPRPIVLGIEEIMKVLPHRYPFLLVDRIVELEPKKRVVGIKNVTINEPFFQGHFPGHPIMPGVLIVEAMAQTGGMLLLGSVPDAEAKVVYFTTLDNVKFRRPVKPGDQLRFELELTQVRGPVCRMRGVAKVDGEVVAEADMSAMVRDR